jgi:UDP-glucose:(heptosyl)LPS alpha-1,3-glucosyltransferase
MKIILLRRRYTAAGGAERFTMRLARRLAEDGHDVKIASEAWPESTEKIYEVLPVRSRDPWSYAKACESIPERHHCLVLSLERTFHQDIFRAGDGLHCAWLERRGRFEPRFRKILNKWNPKHRRVLALEEEVFKETSTRTVIANSPMVKREILLHTRFPEERVHVICAGVNLERFRPVESAQAKLSTRRMLSPNLPGESLIWCFVGSGFDRKGLKWAIRIAARQEEPIHLIVLGRGEQGIYQRLATEERFRDRLHFLPATTDAADVYRASDAFILPTIYDPCANAALEAAVCGLPVITTTANGACDYVEGVFLEDPSNVDEAAERAAVHARPLILNISQAEKARSALDEKKAWEKTIALITKTGSRLSA